MSFRIQRCWVYAAVDPADDEEGVAGQAMFDRRLGQMVFMPLVATNEQRRDELRPFAQQLARESGMTIRLVELSVRRDLEEIHPDGTIN